jgi:hypothetical protein
MSHKAALSGGAYLKVAVALSSAILVLSVLFLSLRSPQSARADAAAAFWSVCPVGCDSPNIQGAIDAAGSGDVIRVVGNNTYVENILITKSLTLLGGCLNAACSVQAPGLLVTTIDGNGAGRTVAIRGQSDSITVVLDGFTITGGDAGGEAERFGGGVGSWYTSLFLTRDVITGNVASPSVSGGRGGGVYVYSGTVHIALSQILSNRASDSSVGDGGGLYLESVTGLLADSRIQDNWAGSASSTSSGGGLYATQCDRLTLSGNSFLSNTASPVGIGYGGGMYLEGSVITLTESTVAYNLASQGDLGEGGGVRVDGSHLQSSGNWLLHNTASVSGNGAGGGIAATESTGVMDGDSLAHNVATLNPAATQKGDGLYFLGGILTGTNLVLARNGTDQGGGGGEGAYLLGSTVPLTITLVNSTIVSNTDVGIRCTGAEFTGTLVNLIAWGNGDDLACGGADLAYSDVEDVGDGGPGVIHQDPLFVDAPGLDFHLRAGSPCIDVGADPISYGFVPDHDWDGDIRPIGAGYDMGADERQHRVYLPLVLRNA